MIRSNETQPGFASMADQDLDTVTGGAGKVDLAGDIGMELQMRLQMYMSRYSSAMEMMSNILHKISSTSNSIVQNLK